MAQELKTANLTGSVSRNAGGLFESVRRLVQHLATRHMEVRVFGVADEFAAADVAAWAPVPVAAFPPAWPRRFGYSNAFSRHLLEFSPDITHTHGLWMYSGIAAGAYSRKTAAPHVISPHGMLDPWALRRSRWKKSAALLLYERRHLRRAYCIRALCLSEAEAIRKLGVKNEIAVIPNGVDLPDGPDPQNGERAKRGENGAPGQRAYDRPQHTADADAVVSLLQTVSGGRKVLLYLGRIHPKKGLVNLLNAWKLTLAYHPAAADWLLVIAGWEQRGHETELKHLATELCLPWSGISARHDLGVQTLIHSTTASAPALAFIGPLFGASKQAAYRECDAFILPSFSEGLPMVVLEAWAHSKPVLMTAACNVPEGFAAGAALRVDPTPLGISAGLDALFSAPSSDLDTMGSRGRALVAAQFSWPLVASQMQALYQWLLGAGAKPGCILQ